MATTTWKDSVRGLQGNSSPKKSRRRPKSFFFNKRKNSLPAHLQGDYAAEGQSGGPFSETGSSFYSVTPTPSEPLSAVHTPRASPSHASAVASHVSTSPYMTPEPRANDLSPASTPVQYPRLSPEQREASFARLLRDEDKDVRQEEQEQSLNFIQNGFVESDEVKAQVQQTSPPSDTVTPEGRSSTSVVLGQQDAFQLAMYIAMAHAALILAGLTLYFLGLLLKDFWWPILWATLCSMPLREVQDWIVGFWEPRLQRGLGPALVSPMLIVCNSVACTTLDVRDGLRRLAGRVLGGWLPGRSSQAWEVREGTSQKQAAPSTGFERLSNWMLTFAVVTLGYDIIGVRGLVTGAVCVAAYFYLKSRAKLDAVIEQQREKATATLQSVWSFVTAPITAPYQLLDHRISQRLLGSIRFLVAISLILGMVIGSLSLSLFFSYRIALEGKAAVVSLNTHVRSSNYAEKLGINQWLEEHQVLEVIDTYSDKAYQVVSDQIDSLASAYNLTTYVDAAKVYLIGGNQSMDECPADMAAVSISMAENTVLLTLQSVKVKIMNSEYKAAYEEAQTAMGSLLGQYNINKEELMERARTLGARAAESGKAFVMGGGTLLANGVSTFASFGKAVASGAADVVNFFAQALFFFSVLYYLMVSEGGGVWEQVLGMIPLPEKTRERSATVLNNAVSAVLLSTVKTTIFQTLFTWLLLRFFRIHFLYMSTMLAALSVIPIFPLWLASVPAGLELVLSRRYLTAGALVIFHQWAMGYGEGSIKDDIPDYNPSLMSLSIAGGMALFHSASQGAILGPLLMTMLLAVKNLYAEFVLGV